METADTPKTTCFHMDHAEFNYPARLKTKRANLTEGVYHYISTFTSVGSRLKFELFSGDSRTSLLSFCYMPADDLHSGPQALDL